MKKRDWACCLVGGREPSLQRVGGRLFREREVSFRSGGGGSVRRFARVRFRCGEYCLVFARCCQKSRIRRASSSNFRAHTGAISRSQCYKSLPVLGFAWALAAARTVRRPPSVAREEASCESGVVVSTALGNRDLLLLVDVPRKVGTGGRSGHVRLGST